MDAVDRFAAEATFFEEWARGGTDQGERAAREALIRLTRLYLAALDLPPAWNGQLADQPDAVRVGDEECRAVSAACARLPFNHYGEVFNPLPIPPEEAVVGSLSDDI